MADAAGAVEALQKAINRAEAQERLPTLQGDLVLLAVVAILLGYFIIEQTHYWTRFPKDHVRFKVLVAWLAFLEAMFFAIRFSGTWITTTNVVVGGAGSRPGFLSVWSTVVTTLIEATVEGFFVFRLWLVTKKLWMRWISIFLWAFSFIAHIVWVCMAGAAGRSNIVDNGAQLRVVIIAFWGTFAEGIFVATCLLYELQFAHDRKVINRHQSSSAVGRLVSLAMRTSGILVIFELMVAIAVSIQTQPAQALLIEVEFSAAIYTVLAAIIVLFTLNWRSSIRAPDDAGGAKGAPQPQGTMPTFLRSAGTGSAGSLPALRAPPAARVNVQTVTTSVVHSAEEDEPQAEGKGKVEELRLEGGGTGAGEGATFLAPQEWGVRARGTEGGRAEEGRRKDGTPTASSIPRETAPFL
ncbi:hypothetical protein JCM10449v2_005187 [Rhodotorula kratochvilovae]